MNIARIKSDICTINHFHRQTQFNKHEKHLVTVITKINSSFMEETQEYPMTIKLLPQQNTKDDC